jgi:FimV-like protein
MEARFVQGPKGSSYVSISTSSPIMEPIVTFRLKVYVGDEVRMRNFALTPSPAARARRAAVTRARPSAAITPRSTIDGPTYTVVRGDTLWGIAQRVGRTNNAETANVVTEIFAANPHAFANGNQNQLMLGAQLSLPSAGATIADATSSDTPVSTTSPVRWQERKPELAAELEALKQKYAALKERYDLNSSQVLASEIVAPTTTAMVDVAPNATSELQAAEESPTVELAALPEVDQVQSETPAISASSAPEHRIVEASSVEMPEKPATKEAAIDMNIAHGRYAEAETLLAEVIVTSPRNYPAKLRLIEVFYMTERIEEFRQLARTCTKTTAPT